jgi:hypothetical protein
MRAALNLIGAAALDARGASVMRLKRARLACTQAGHLEAF